MESTGKTINLNRQSEGLRGFPPHTVCALLDEPDRIERIMKELREGGVPDSDVHVWTGETGAAALHPDSDHSQGFFGRLAQSLRQLSAERAYIARYAELVNDGKTAIAVRYHDSADRSAYAESVLRRNGGTKMFVLGDWTLTVLEDESASKAE